MSCTCRIGSGRSCDFCRSRNATEARFSDLQQQLLRLAERVVRLEEAILAQATIIDDLRCASDPGLEE